MYIESIKLKNFRNYQNEEIKLTNGINLFYGNNAQGKTNILESVFLCSMGKSFRARKDKELIAFGEKKTSVQVEYRKKDRQGEIYYLIDENHKEIAMNQIKIKKLSALLGNLNIVLFSPEDINIIKDGPTNRRKFLNMLISQLRPKYVYYYNLYLKTLEQRNHYLKNGSIENINQNLLDIYDEKLAEIGTIIWKYREEFIQKIKEKINQIHQTVTNEKETIKLTYISDCGNQEQYLQKLKENRSQDLLRGYTSVGIQRDDIYFYINGKKIDTYGSQGQQRTSILSLKLTELEIIKDEIGEYPILLLDDFMSELDQQRTSLFLKNIKDTQILITCTENMAVENVPMNRYEVKEGKVFERNT